MTLKVDPLSWSCIPKANQYPAFVLAGMSRDHLPTSSKKLWARLRSTC